MTGPNRVVTAGHCVYSHDKGGFATVAIVEPDRNEESKPYGSASAIKGVTVKGWSVNKDWDYDIGVFILSSNIGLQTGYFGLSATDTLIINKTVNLVGYPDEKQPASSMWKDINKIKSDQGLTLKFNLDMTAGQSGAPLYYYDASLGQTAIALNSLDVFNSGVFSHNQAVKFTSKNFDLVANYQ